MSSLEFRVSSRVQLYRGLSILIALFVASAASPRIVPAINLRTLVSQAELIIVGRVVEVGTTPAVLGDSSTAMTVPVKVALARVLKGRHPQGVVLFRSAPPETASLTGPIRLSRFGIFFLRYSGDALESVDPFYPVLPAQPESRLLPGDAFDRVVAELVPFLELEATSEAEFRLAIYILRTARHPLLTEKLKGAAQREGTLALLALSELLSRGDISLLPKAESILTTHPRPDQTEIVKALGESLAGISDPNAVPALSRLVLKGPVEARRAAATALGNTRGRKAIPALGEALYDVDQQVRYQAVIALEEIRRQSHWAMSVEYFQENEKKLIQSWRDWVKASAKPQTN